MADYAEGLNSSSKGNTIVPVMGGLLGLAVAMGIGRFAYTPLLPIMQQHTHFSATFAGVLASWNYFGYLIGAILTAVVPAHIQRDMKLRYRVIIIALMVSVLTTALMGLTSSHAWWSILRGLGGLSSAIVLVMTSSFIMDWLAKNDNAQQSGILYSGVGVGIALTGILVPFLSRNGEWKTGWLGLACVGAVLTIVAWVCLRTIRNVSLDYHSANKQQTESTSPFPLWSIMLAYGLEGIGYIVMATFITEFFRGQTTAPWLGSVSWVIVGLAGVPSTWLWAKAARRWGAGRAIVTAFVAQAVGVLLPVSHAGILEAIVGSILLGGTFMGITALGLFIGRMCAPERAGTVIGTMTAMFSIGQVVGPIFAGIITAQTHSFRPAMGLSGLVILVAALLLMFTRKRLRQSPA